MSTVTLLLGKTTSVDHRRGKWGGDDSVSGQTVVARRDDLRDGRSQTRHTQKEQMKMKRLRAQRKLTDGPYHTQGPTVPGVMRCATALFATEAQGKAHQSKSREIIYENTRLHMVSEGKQHLGRAVDGNFR
jgi:hypothetical protein